jgi:hypothetical protein
MSKFCIDCGLPKATNCDCSTEYKPPAVKDLTYVNTDVTLAQAFCEQFTNTRDSLDTEVFTTLRNQVDPTPRNIRKVSAFVIQTINTETDKAEQLNKDVMAGNFADDKRAIEATRDGAKKWELYADWFPSDLAEKVAKDFKAGNWSNGMIRLSGRDPETGENVRETYLRPVKASLVAYLLGDDKAMCMDRRVFRALKPVLDQVLTEKVRQHPQTEDDRMRTTAQRMDADHKSLMVHKTADNLDTDYWCDGMALNLGEYRAITAGLIDLIAEQTNTDKHLVPIVLFNMGDYEPTIHEGVLRNLAEN